MKRPSLLLTALVCASTSGVLGSVPAFPEASPSPAASPWLAASPSPAASPLLAAALAPEEGRFVDKEGGFSLTPPARWRPVDPAAFTVPGTLRAGWSPDASSSILVFTAHLAEPVTASFLLAQHQAAARRTPGAEIREERTLELAGKRVMSFIFTAPGTGGAVDGRGGEPTAQHWVAVPHQREVLFLLLTCPEIGFAPSDATFRTVLATLEVSGSQTDDQTLPR